MPDNADKKHEKKDYQRIGVEGPLMAVALLIGVIGSFILVPGLFGDSSGEVFLWLAGLISLCLIMYGVGRVIVLLKSVLEKLEKQNSPEIEGEK